MEKFLKKLIDELFENEEVFKRCFFLMQYEGIITTKFSFIMNEPLYCEITASEMKEILMQQLETSDQKIIIYNFFKKMFCKEINFYYNEIRKLYLAK